jgi:hypothetical protein
MISDKSTPHHEREAAKAMLKKHGHSEAGDSTFAHTSPVRNQDPRAHADYARWQSQGKKDFEDDMDNIVKNKGPSPYRTHDHAKAAMCHGFRYEGKENTRQGNVKYTYKHAKGDKVHIHVNPKGETDRWEHDPANAKDAQWMSVGDATSFHKHLSKHGLYA